ncbi:MAG: alanine--tRNA ligase [Verrucomicrobiota bacterium]
MTSADIRQSFLDFFQEKQHTMVASASLMPDSPGLLFTNAGMNQFVPIFLNEQPCPYDPPRAADTQKCIRAGGKHNDLEDVGMDTYHHTFFEMLGNWSFGDYFKQEAIEWAWELLTERWKLPKERLYATVYKPGEGDPADFDQEAYDIWKKILEDAGLDPAVHIVYGNKKDNFWMMGDTGPCGPCSEVHMDLTPDGDTKGSLVNADDARCIEIWNLVFIQFNAHPDGSFKNLPACHVDTGMGFERVCSIMQGTKNFTDFSKQVSNYDTDVFAPIFSKIEELSGKTYSSTLLEDIEAEGPDFEIRNSKFEIDIAMRVIADHIRTLSCSIADGILPSNEGRGYVLRRILRRAVRYGRQLGFHDLFFYQLVGTIADEMGDVFPELRSNQATVEKVIKAEEQSFSKTLDKGISLFDNKIFSNAIVTQLHKDGFLQSHGSNAVWLGEDEEIPEEVEYNSMRIHKQTDDGKSEFIAKYTFDELRNGAWKKYTSQKPIVSGEDAFKLFDTYGFPLDLTELMARERGIAVDVAGFEQCMTEQRERSKAAQKKSVISVKDKTEENLIPTEFVGFENKADVNVEVCNFILDMPAEEGGTVTARLYLSPTPFYGEMGGQLGDTGWLEFGGQKIEIIDTQKSTDESIAAITEDVGMLEDISFPLKASVDAGRRHLIESHHSATHLLGWALREVLGNTVQQKGSYVGSDRLRFDFSHIEAMKPDEIDKVGELVNDRILHDAGIQWYNRPYAEVKHDPDIIQFFGDKYGETVRVVDIGGFSRELCGGTHVDSTLGIGPFRLVHEGAIAAGVRRIEAICGDALRPYLLNEQEKVAAVYEQLKSKKSDTKLSLTRWDEEMVQVGWDALSGNRDVIEQLREEIKQWEKDQAKAKQSELLSQAATLAPEWARQADYSGSIPVLIQHIAGGDGKFLQVVLGELKKHFNGVAVLAGDANERVALAVSVSPDYVKTVKAGDVIKAMGPYVGGKGGGRPEMAQGGGTNPSGIPAAFETAKALCKSF